MVTDTGKTVENIEEYIKRERKVFNEYYKKLETF
jgi:hypothetical protein